MDWLSKNWIWIVVALGVLLMFRHHGGLGTRRSHQDGAANRGVDTALDSQARWKDPVSGEQVDPASAINSTYQDHTYYFASRENRDKFEATPARYATASAPLADTHRHRRHGC